MRSLAVLPVVVLLGWLALSGATASAATLWVSPHGSATATGTRRAPLGSIGAAVARARPGDTVRVTSGRYPETVQLTARSAGVSLVGTGPTRPLIDGGGVRQYGVYLNATAPGVRIERFEIAHQTTTGIQLTGDRLQVIGNDVHDVGSAAVNLSDGIQLSQARQGTVRGNHVHSIGPGGESDGIRLINARDTRVADNVIELVRKEGVRDWTGLDNTIEGNAISLCYVGVALSSSLGSTVRQNYLHDNTIGFNPKHTADSTSYPYWHVSGPRWNRFYRNTVFRSSDASVWLAMNPPAADWISVRDNYLDGAGDAFVGDAPDARGPHVELDGNVYSRGGGAPSTFYMVGFDATTPGAPTLRAMRDELGWERSGVMEPTAPDPWQTTPDARALAGHRNARGRPVGAQRSATETRAWTPWAMRPVVSSSSAKGPGVAAQLQDAADGRQRTYWQTSSPSGQRVTYDLGDRRPIDVVLLENFSHLDPRAVRGYHVEASDDGRRFRTVAAGTNPDSEGSSYKYVLPRVVNARYVRFSLLSTFCAGYRPRTGCGPYFVMSDLRVGDLAPRRAGAPAGRRTSGGVLPLVLEALRLAQLVLGLPRAT